MTESAGDHAKCRKTTCCQDPTDTWIVHSPYRLETRNFGNRLFGRILVSRDSPKGVRGAVPFMTASLEGNVFQTLCQRAELLAKKRPSNTMHDEHAAGVSSVKLPPFVSGICAPFSPTNAREKDGSNNPAATRSPCYIERNTQVLSERREREREREREEASCCPNQVSYCFFCVR